MSQLFEFPKISVTFLLNDDSIQMADQVLDFLTQSVKHYDSPCLVSA